MSADDGLAICYVCPRYAQKERMETIDVSREDEYYPKIRYLCRNCSGNADPEDYY